VSTVESVVAEMPQHPSVLIDGGFDFLDGHSQRQLGPRPGELAMYGGSCAINEAIIIQTPPSVRAAGNVLTNPTQIEDQQVLVGRERAIIPTIWARHEPAHEHMGHTTARKYAILTNKSGGMYLSEFAAAAEISGEDGRWTPDVRMPGHLGVHEGDLLTVIQATADPNDPQRTQGIQPVFWWAPKEMPAKMEVVAVGQPGTKNLNTATRYIHEDDTRLDVIGRPHPNLSYFTVADPTAITPDRVAEAVVIPGLLPADSPVEYHLGGNYVYRVDAGRLRINGHQAWSSLLSPGSYARHYRLADYGYALPTRDTPKGRAVFLGVTATRSQFPTMTPKPPEGDVGDFDDILFGCTGANGHAVFGVADNYIGYAAITRSGDR
jgi:hypothetical protein